MSHTMIVYTDGSALGNPGPGGWAYLIINKKEKIVIEGGGHGGHTTNNQMELSALLNVLIYLNKLKDANDIIIYLDSDYVRNGITSWIHNWKKNNWHTANKKSVLNKELWVQIDIEFEKAKTKHKIKLERVDGHSGVTGNEIVDQIAKAMAGKTDWDLYSGPINEFEKLREISL